MLSKSLKQRVHFSVQSLAQYTSRMEKNIGLLVDCSFPAGSAPGGLSPRFGAPAEQAYVAGVVAWQPSCQRCWFDG